MKPGGTATAMTRRQPASAGWTRWIGGVGIGVAFGLHGQGLANEPPVVIRALEGLRYEPARLRVEPGQAVILRFENADTTAQPHNLVVVRPGTRETVLAAALALGAEGPDRGYVPESADVVAASRLLAAGEDQSLMVRFPEAPGVYPIVCTFPGHGVLMFGAVYVGTEMPARVEDDPHVPKPPPVPVIAPDPRPMVRRIFLPDSSPASIAVALAGGQNLCWDAGPCRLRYGWLGPFLDAEDHFKGKGQALAKPGASVAWRTPDEFPVRLEGRRPTRVRFRGYEVRESVPGFEYTIDDKLVIESFSVVNARLVRRFRFPGEGGMAEILASVPPLDAVVMSGGGERAGDWLRLGPGRDREVTIEYGVSGPPSDDPK